MTLRLYERNIARWLTVFVSLVFLSGCYSPTSGTPGSVVAVSRALPAPGLLGRSGFEVRSGRLALHSRTDVSLDFSHLPLRGPRHPYTLELRFYIAGQAHPCVITDPEAYRVSFNVENGGSVYAASYRLEKMGVTAFPPRVRPSYVGDPFYYLPLPTATSPGTWESSATGKSLLKVSITRKPSADDVIACEVVLRTGGTK